MANQRVPGPLSQEQHPWSTNDGTLAQCLMPKPGATGIDALLRQSIDATFALAGQPEPDLSFLFLQCRNPQIGLSDTDYSEAATTLGVEVAAIKAVADVETSGKAFDIAGRPQILFERHYFHRLTKGKFSAKHPQISNASRGGYGASSAQYQRLEQVYKLDANAALRSASWGRFQIMGDHFGKLGFTSVKHFVFAMTKSESEHLKIFTRFVLNNSGMLNALRKKNWAKFAAAYNGSSYKENKYDTKLATAYESHKPKDAGKKPTLP
jgi:hypothetical protein